MQHLNYCRTLEFNPKIRPEPTTTVSKRTEASNTLQQNKEPYNTCQNYAKAASTILVWEDSSTNGHYHIAASKSKQNSKNQSTGQASTYHYRPEQATSIKHLTDPSRSIEILPQPCKSSYNQPEKAGVIYNWP